MKHPVKNTAKNFCWPSSATTAGVADRQDNPLASQRNSPRGRLELPVPRAPGEDPSYGAPPAKCLLTFHQRPELEKHRGSNYPHEGVPGRTRNSWCRGWRSAHCPLSTVNRFVNRFNTVRASSTTGLELPSPGAQRKDPRTCQPSGGYLFFTGDTGDKLKNARKSLSPLRKTVPGNTGGKRKSAGDTGDK